MHHRASVPLLLLLLLLLALLAAVPARPASAFSVLAHQAVIDRSWDDVIVPALRDRLPAASPDEIGQARASMSRFRTALDEHDFATSSREGRDEVVQHHRQPVQPAALADASRPPDADEARVSDDVGRALARLGAAPARN